MKTCKNCGAMIEDDAKTCDRCGASCEENLTVADKRPEENPDMFNFPPGQPAKYSLKWHNFLVVVLIIGAIFTAISAVRTFAGLDYRSEGIDPERVYSFYPGLKACDLLYGAAMICVAVYQIYVRNQLKNFRVNAPKLLSLLYIASLVINLIYLSAASNIIGESLFVAENIGTLVGSAAFLIINSVYYSKRKELFKY